MRRKILGAIGVLLGWLSNRQLVPGEDRSGHRIRLGSGDCGPLWSRDLNSWPQLPDSV
jgi:hypothetical protein